MVNQSIHSYFNFFESFDKLRTIGFLLPDYNPRRVVCPQDHWSMIDVCFGILPTRSGYCANNVVLVDVHHLQTNLNYDINAHTRCGIHCGNHW